MADEKISAMPAAAPLGPELVPMVQGGVNKSCTPAQIAALGGGGGGPHWITPAGGNLSWANIALTAGINLGDNGALGILMSQNSQFQVTGLGGNATMFWQAGVTWTLNVSGSTKVNFIIGAGGQMTMDPVANSFFCDGFASYDYGYVAATPLNWVGGVSRLERAVDRLAAALIARTVGGPIP